MTVKYKRTKAVEAIYENISKYLYAMGFAGKKPSKLYLTTKQYEALLADENKRRESIEEPKISRLNKVMGYDVEIYNA